MPAGYSKTPLAKKLGLKAGHKALIINSPSHYFDILAPIPEDIYFSDNPNEFEEESLDFIHVFAFDIETVKKYFEACKPLVKKNGSIWFSWPKKTSDFPAEQKNLKREPVREAGLAIGLVDVKVAAIDDNWSGLKFMYRIVDR